MLGFRTDPSAAMKAEKRNPVGPRTPETYCWKGQAIVKDHPRANQALPPCLHRAWLESSEELSDPSNGPGHGHRESGGDHDCNRQDHVEIPCAPIRKGQRREYHEEKSHDD